MTAARIGPTANERPVYRASGNVRHTSFDRARGDRPDPELWPFWAEALSGDPDAALARQHVRQGHSFADMCADLLAGLPGGYLLELVVLAHVTPDLDARKSVAGALAAPGRLVFAVSDQGRLAPFTALQVAAAFPDRRHAAVIAVDQAVVPYSDSDFSALDADFDHAVMLLPATGFDRVRQWAGVSGDQIAGLLDAALLEEDPDLVIVGPALPPPNGLPWLRAPGDQLGTAVFSALSDVLAEDSGMGSPAERITVVEYEPAIGGLALVTWFRVSPSLSPVPERQRGDKIADCAAGMELTVPSESPEPESHERRRTNAAMRAGRSPEKP